MKFTIFLVVLLVVPSILGDSSEEVEDEAEKNDEEEQEYDDEQEEEEDFVTSTSSPKVNPTKSRPLEDISSLNRRFSAQIYKKISEKLTSSFVFSPLALLTTLSLLQSSSRGLTKEEIRRFLDSSVSNQEEQIQNLLIHFSREKLFTFNSFIKMYISSNFAIVPSSRQVLLKYQASAEKVDFGKKQRTAKRINKWVEKNTYYKIKRFVNPENLFDNITSIIVNVMAIKAEWNTPFPKFFTLNQNFSIDSQNLVGLKSMNHLGKFFDYGECDELEATFLKLPLEGESGSVVLVLPNNASNLVRLENKIEDVLKFRAFFEERVNVVLPKFRVKTKIDYKSILKAQGVQKLFESNHEDLNEIATGRNNFLKIDRLVQEIAIDIAEGGINIRQSLDPVFYATQTISFPETKNFIVNRPCLFYVELEDVVVLLGKIKYP